MNTQTEERRSDNLAFRRMFEPKLIDPKLSGAGVLTFSTSVVMKAYQVMVSSTEHNEVKFLDGEVSSADVIYDRLLETAFPGKLVRDPVVMVRIWELGDTEWSLWKDVDVSEYVSAHQEIRKTTDLPEETQLAFLPEVIPPTNGDHGVNGNGNRLPWWQSGWKRISALAVMVKRQFTSRPSNGHDGHNNQQRTTETEEMNMNNTGCSITSKKISIQPNPKAIGYITRLVVAGSETQAVNQIEVDSMPSVFGFSWVEKMKLNDGHPIRDTEYTLEVLVLEDGTNQPQKIGEAKYSAEKLAKMFGVGVVEKSDKPAATVKPPTQATAPASNEPVIAPVTTPVVCRFPDFNLEIDHMPGASKFTVEVVINDLIVGASPEEFETGPGPTLIKDFLKNVKFLKGHPDQSVDYQLRITALTDDAQVVGTPSIYSISGADIQQALNDDKTVVDQPATDSQVAPTPANAPTTKAFPKAGIDNLNERLTWIELQITTLENAWYADYHIKPKMKKVRSDIGRHMEVYGKNEVNLVGFMERVNKASKALAEALAKLQTPANTASQAQPAGSGASAPVTQTQAKAPVAQVIQTVTPPPTGTNQVPPQPPTPPIVPSTPLVPAPQSGGGLKWVAMGCGLMALLAMALFVVVVGIIVYYKLANHSTSDNGVTRRPLVTQPVAPRPLPVPTVIPSPVVAATPATNTPQGGITTVVETRDGNKVSTTVTNSNGFIAIAPAIGENSQVKIIQVGGNYSDPSGSQVNGMGEWPNDSAPTVTTNICLSKPLASGEEEVFVLTINPADDIAITLQTGNCTVLHYVTSPDGKGDVVPTPVKLYDIAFNGRRIDSTGGSEGSNCSILRLRNRTGARIILGLRCVKN